MSGEATLFARLGGEAGLAQILDALYERLLADDYLGEYFMGVDIDRLKAMQLGFMRRLFGDDGATYGGAPLQAAHHGQLVTEHAFDQFIDEFVAVAGELGADEATRQDARAALKLQRASVITEFKPNPAYNYPTRPS
jgi:hemoglobin